MRSRFDPAEPEVEFVAQRPAQRLGVAASAVGGEVMKASRPSWLDEDCPTWCVREHREQDRPDDRYHFSEASTVPVIAFAELSVDITASMHGLDLVVWVGRYLGERLEWVVIEPAQERDPHLILIVESAGLLLRHIDRQLLATGHGKQ